MQKIIVENFGPIKHAEVELRDFVVLIGEQASGKSTLAKLVYFFNSLGNEFTLIASKTKADDRTKLLEELARETTRKFARYFGFPPLLSRFKIRFYFSVETDKYVELHLEQKSPKDFSVHSTYSPEFNKGFNDHLTKMVKDFQAGSSEQYKIKGDESEEEKSRKQLYQILMVKKTGDNIYNTHFDPVFFPAGRTTSVQFSELFKQTFYGAIVSKLDSTQSVFSMSDSILMREFLDRVAILKDFINPHKTFEVAYENFKMTGDTLNQEAIEFFLKTYSYILKGKYSSGGDGEKILYDSESHSIPIEQASSGQQESLRILQDIFNTLVVEMGVFRVIEEPEAHLFPKAQKYLIELLSLMINSTTSQLLITTHSPYVLSVLANLLYANKLLKLESATDVEIEQKSGISKLTWLSKDKFAAYTMDDGQARSIFDREQGMIDQNYLDQISEELGTEFNTLYRMRAKQIKNAS